MTPKPSSERRKTIKRSARRSVPSRSKKHSITVKVHNPRSKSRVRQGAAAPLRSRDRGEYYDVEEGRRAGLIDVVVHGRSPHYAVGGFLEDPSMNVGGETLLSLVTRHLKQSGQTVGNFIGSLRERLRNQPVDNASMPQPQYAPEPAPQPQPTQGPASPAVPQMPSQSGGRKYKRHQRKSTRKQRRRTKHTRKHK